MVNSKKDHKCENVTIYAKIHEEFYKTNRFCIAHTKQEIGAIIQISVLCVDGTWFSHTQSQMMIYIFSLLNNLIIVSK